MRPANRIRTRFDCLPLSRGERIEGEGPYSARVFGARFKILGVRAPVWLEPQKGKSFRTVTIVVYRFVIYVPLTIRHTSGSHF